MFISSGTFHPASIGYSAMKQSRKISQKRLSECSAKIVAGSPDSMCCELQLITALQGIEADAAARHLIAMTIMQMSDAQKLAIINFLVQIAIPAAMENNACKVFSCATQELGTALSEEFYGDLIMLWNKTLKQIIPNAQAMLYPLKAYSNSFDIGKSILTSFRDRVLLKVLSNIHCSIPLFHSMISYICFATADDSANYVEFSKIADTVLGVNGNDSADDERQIDKRYKMEKNSRTRRSEPISIGAIEKETARKKRSATLPARTVHWADLSSD